MLVTRRSTYSGKLATMELPVTQERITAWEGSDELIQRAFPELSADQREFLLTGITPDEWAEIFGGDCEG